MAQLEQTKIYGDLELNGEFLDSSGDAGTSGQMLSSTGSSLHNEIKITASDIGGTSDANFSEGVAIGNGKMLLVLLRSLFLQCWCLWCSIFMI